MKKNLIVFENVKTGSITYALKMKKIYLKKREMYKNKLQNDMVKKVNIDEEMITFDEFR